MNFCKKKLANLQEYNLMLGLFSEKVPTLTGQNSFIVPTLENPSSRVFSWLLQFRLQKRFFSSRSQMQH